MQMQRLISEQCVAKSKRSGKRCKRLVRGGGVCVMHGGAAPQVERAREARVAVAEARVMFGGEYAQRDPGAVLLGAVADIDAIVQRIKDKIELSGELTAHDLDALGQWLDRASRMAKTALDAGVQERQVQIQEAVMQQIVRQVIQKVEHVVRALGHDPDDRAVMAVVAQVMRQPINPVVEIEA